MLMFFSWLQVWPEADVDDCPAGSEPVGNWCRVRAGVLASRVASVYLRSWLRWKHHVLIRPQLVFNAQSPSSSRSFVLFGYATIIKGMYWDRFSLKAIHWDGFCLKT